jgi:hypothetical protein
MRRWPQALIGLRSGQIDARTFGSTALQQFIDQLTGRGYRDGTLNGPTTTAWLDHWQLYLESLGVKFNIGRLARLELRGGAARPCIKPIFSDETGETPVKPSTSGGSWEPAYVVLALPVHVAWEVARDLKQELERTWDEHPWKRALWESSDFPALLAMLDDIEQDRHESYSPDWLGQDDPPGPLQNFAGVQFFLDEDYRFTPGHTYYPRSAWGLTSISQTRFRQDQAEARFKYRGVISVVIGTWNAEGTELHKKKAWNCSNQELAEECWAQMTAHAGTRKPPLPVWFNVDANVSRVNRKGVRDDDGNRRNVSPYLTTGPGRFAGWPGEVGDYSVRFGNLVLAGSYMKTHTRLVTMEAANESARHAVNAILRDWTTTPGRGHFDGPVLWNLEEEEWRDLEHLKAIDARLCEEGLPHAFEILRLEELLTAGGDGEGHPATLLDALSRVAVSQGRVLATFIDGVRGSLFGRR